MYSSTVRPSFLCVIVGADRSHDKIYVAVEIQGLILFAKYSRDLISAP